MYNMSNYGHFYHSGPERWPGENAGYYYFGHLRRLFWKANGCRIKCFSAEEERTIKADIEHNTLPERIREVMREV